MLSICDHATTVLLFGHMTRASDQDTRSRILSAAADEIADAGWGGCRTRSIAQRAGVNSGVIHYHFSSMEDLLVEAVAVTFASFADAAAASISADTIAGGMAGMLEFVSGIDPSDPTWQVLMEAMLHGRRVPRLAEFTVGLLDQYRMAMKARLDEGMRAGEIPSDSDTEGLALGLMALFDGLGLYAYVNPEYDTRRAGRAIVTLLTKGPAHE